MHPDNPWKEMLRVVVCIVMRMFPINSYIHSAWFEETTVAARCPANSRTGCDFRLGVKNQTVRRSQSGNRLGIYV
jgi:hypothetical protein